MAPEAEDPRRVEFLYWSECPSWERALQILREEVEAAGLNPAAIGVEEVREDERAAELGFPGSPTIRVGGRDIQDPGQEPIGLTCRVYRLRDGRASPLPDRADVHDALQALGAA